jgi:hypothetical protein
MFVCLNKEESRGCCRNDDIMMVGEQLQMPQGSACKCHIRCITIPEKPLNPHIEATSYS